MNTLEPLALGVAGAAALRTGILAALVQGPLTDVELVERLKLDLRATRLLLGVLETVGYVRRDGNRFAAGEVLRAAGDAPGGFALSFGMGGHVEEFVRTGEPFALMDQAAPERERIYQNLVGGLANLFEGLARELATRLPLSPRSILDVGCGAGVWSLALAQQHPNAHVTGLDFPGVLKSFSDRASTLGLADRAHTLPGDMHDVEPPAGAFDLVVIANVLRLETPERAARVVERAAKAVSADGAILVIDSLAHGTPEAERARAIYALHLGLRTRSGEVHSPATISRWLTANHFSQISTIPLPDAGTVGVLLATRSAR